MFNDHYSWNYSCSIECGVIFKINAISIIEMNDSKMNPIKIISQAIVAISKA